VLACIAPDAHPLKTPVVRRGTGLARVLAEPTVTRIVSEEARSQPATTAAGASSAPSAAGPAAGPAAAFPAPRRHLTQVSASAAGVGPLSGEYDDDEDDENDAEDDEEVSASRERTVPNQLQTVSQAVLLHGGPVSRDSTSVWACFFSGNGSSIHVGVSNYARGTRSNGTGTHAHTCTQRSACFFSGTRRYPHCTRADCCWWTTRSGSRRRSHGDRCICCLGCSSGPEADR
jgi:hypothetical protein